MFTWLIFCYKSKSPVQLQVQQVMSDVQQRHDQMRQLESSMLELHQVFLDMSILVADQGDTINNIDNWVRHCDSVHCDI